MLPLLRAGLPTLLLIAAVLVVPGGDASHSNNAIQGNPGASGPITVNTLGDAPDASPGDGHCDSDASTAGRQCTLRAAIETINCEPCTGARVIEFGDFPFLDVDTDQKRQINLTAPLVITNRVLVDAREFQDRVRINGEAVVGDCLVVDPGGTRNVTLYGLHLFGCGGASMGSGIHVRSGEGEIGTVGAGNWIINSTGYGIHIDSVANDRAWTVRANHIGFLPNGTNGTNGLGGILVSRDTAGGDGENIILGGLHWRMGNHIGNNAGNGITVDGYDDVRILSNLIGTNITWSEWQDVLDDHDVRDELVLEKWDHGNTGPGILLDNVASTLLGLPPFDLFEPEDARGNNTLWFNGGGGVLVVHGVSSHDNYVRGNSFYEPGEAILNVLDEPIEWRPGIIAASSITDKVTVRLHAGPDQSRNDVVVDLYGMDSCTLDGAGSRVAWLGGYSLELDAGGRISADDEVITVVDKVLDPWAFVSAAASYVDEGLLTSRIGACFPVSHPGFTATASTTTTTTAAPTPTATVTATVTGPGPTVTVGPAGPQPGDSDGDGLSDAAEVALGTDPYHWDTDRDGASDFDEVAAAADPLSAASQPPESGAPGAADETPVSLWVVFAALAAALIVRRRFPA